MSISNLEYRGILNSGNQIIQRPIAFNKNEEISIYEVNFNNVDNTGSVFNGVLGSTINQGTNNYLPIRDETGIKLIETGIYCILIQVRNLTSIISGGGKYLFTIKISTGSIVSQTILDLTSKKTINVNERVSFKQNYLNSNAPPYYFEFECECIEGVQSPLNFSAYFTILRNK
jgi:hypothetical protein